MRITCKLAVLAVITSVLASCDSKNGPEIPEDAVITIYGRSYHLGNAALWRSNPYIVSQSSSFVWNDEYTDSKGQQVSDQVEGFTAGDGISNSGNFILSLYETGLQVNTGLESVQGRGACVSFHLATENTEGISAGTYKFSADRSPFTFIGYLCSDYTTQSLTNVPGQVPVNNPAELADGELVITKDGTDSYTVNFICTTTFGAEVSGKYTGRIPEYKVSQVASSAYNDIELAGLLKTVTISQSYNAGGGVMIPLGEETGFDISNGKAFLSLSSGMTQYANTSRKDVIDIALVWDEASESFVFTSPIKMRSFLGHDHKYDFPCHTRFMPAPESFTDADFTNFSSFNFKVEDKQVTIPTRDFKPKYLFFETGNGIQGVIRVRSFIPASSYVEDYAGVLFTTRPINPSIKMDVKCPAVVDNPRIR